MKKPLTASLSYRDGVSPKKTVTRSGYQLITVHISLSDLLVGVTVNDSGDVTVTYENEAGVPLHETSENLFTLLKNEGNI